MWEESIRSAWRQKVYFGEKFDLMCDSQFSTVDVIHCEVRAVEMEMPSPVLHGVSAAPWEAWAVH